MNEKEYKNTFRFVLSQGDTLLCEKCFDADKFNPFTRYSINIRDILPKSITKIQKVLSKKKYDTLMDVGREDVTKEGSHSLIYDLYENYLNNLNFYSYGKKSGLDYNPQIVVQQIDGKTIRGVECKIGFYINENPIVERLFYVDGFNPIARWSVDMVETVIEITDSIFEKIKECDIKNMWDDYDLINGRGLSINQIRELSIGKREEFLRNLRK